MIGGQVQVLRSWPLPDAARGVVHGAVARAEPAVVGALMRERDAAEVGADADQNEPLVLAWLDAVLVGLRIGQAAELDVARLLDLLLGAVADEDRLAAPEHLDDLSLGDRAKVHLDRGAGGDRRSIRVHLRDQRHQRRCAADRGHRAGCNVEEIASGRLGRSCCHSPSPSLAGQPTHAEDRERIDNARWRLGRPPPVLGEDERRRSGGVYWHPYKGSASPPAAQ